MNTSKKIGSVALALAVALGLASGPALAGGGKSLNKNAPEALVGAWRVKITPYSCGSTEDDVPVLPLLPDLRQGRHDAGDQGSTRSFQPGQRSVGHGYWVRTGKGTYHAVFEAFVHFRRTRQQPPAGLSAGSQRLQQDIQMMDADSWESDAEIYFYDTDRRTDRWPSARAAPRRKARGCGRSLTAGPARERRAGSPLRTNWFIQQAFTSAGESARSIAPTGPSNW